MNRKSVLIFMCLGFLGAGIFLSCTEKVSSNPNYIFKPAPKQGVVGKVMGQEITEDELYKGMENDIFEAEAKLYELKFNKLQSIVLEKFMNAHPQKKGLTNDQFLEQHIALAEAPNDKDIEAFIKERNIPQEHINDQMKERIKSYLTMEKKRVAVEKWLGEQTQKNPVEVYIPKPKRPVFNVEAGDAPFWGSATAKVTLVEFSDFQCPFCAKGAERLKELKEKYGDKIKIVFKQYPLPFHQQAKGAAEASLCADEQSRDFFWKFHDYMFANQSKLQVDELKKAAGELGLDAAKFASCMDEHRTLKKVEENMAEGEKIGVKSTPTFFVNGKLVAGAQPLEEFVSLIDEEMAK